jgi:hypothetical protein
MKFRFILLAFLVLMAVLFGFGLILAQEDTTIPMVCQDTAGYKTFNNSHLSFQYPTNCTVTELEAATVQISTINPVDKDNSGIFIQVLDRSKFLAARDEAASQYQLEYELEDSGGVDYSQYTHNTGNITLYTYFFSKNGKYYRMFGNVEDDQLMVQLLDSVQ